MTHKTPPPDFDPLDLVVKGIFFILLPVSTFILSLFLLTIGIHMVIT